MKDFEKAAIRVDGGNGMIIRELTSERTRRNVPLSSLWTAGRQILPYLEHAVDRRNSHIYLNIQGFKKSVKEIYHELLEA